MARYECWNHPEDETVIVYSSDTGVTCPDCGATMTYCGGSPYQR